MDHASHSRWVACVWLCVQGCTYIVQEFCPGGDLYMAIRKDKDGQLTWYQR